MKLCLPSRAAGLFSAPRHSLGAFSRARGFSLLEILIVVALIAIIGGMVARSVFGGSDRAKVGLAKTQILTLSGKIEQFELDTGALPQALDELVNSPGGGGWLGPYAKLDELKDPWGTPFEYNMPGAGRPFDITSLGADRQSGGESVAGDISND